MTLCHSFSLFVTLCHSLSTVTSLAWNDFPLSLLDFKFLRCSYLCTLVMEPSNLPPVPTEMIELGNNSRTMLTFTFYERLATFFTKIYAYYLGIGILSTDTF